MSALSDPAPWDVVADGYTRVTMSLFSAYSEAALEYVPVRTNDHIADIACGPGTLAMLAAERGAQVAAVDFSANMIARLKENVAAQGLGEVRPRRGDGQELPFDDSVFDAAFSMFGLMFFPNRTKGYREMLRTLRPDARGCVSSWAPVAESSLLLTMLKAMQEVNPDIPDPEYDINSLENPQVLRSEMSYSGFRNVEVYSVDETTEYACPKTFWEDMAQGSAPTAIMKAKMPADEWRSKSELAIRHIDKIAGPFPRRFNAKAWLGVGRK
ncbi:MAG: class I SAM-dependent methyltransferase [Pseudomonadota bacterium]